MSPSWLDRTLAQFPSGGCGLFIRHAGEYTGLKADDPQNMPADDRVQQFGSRLKGMLGVVVTAPGKNSVSTAKRILDAAGSGSELIVNSDIGDPSIYVRDLDLCRETYKGLDPEQARQRLLDGILRGPARWAAPDPGQAARDLLAKLASWIEPRAVSVFVSPSVAITATVALALGLEGRMGHGDSPAALQGAVLYRGDGYLRVSMGALTGKSVL